MSLVVLAYHCHPDYRLLLAGNRDEFHARPAAGVAWWPDLPGVLAGRDLAAGGTWLGVDRRGRLGVITNFRDPGAHRPDAPSRGALIPRFLAADAAATDFAPGLAAAAQPLSGFSLLLFDGEQLVFAANRPAPRTRSLAPGIYGLSNHSLDTPWPKLERTRRRLVAAIAAGRPPPDRLLRLLRDREPAADHALPDTGVGRERERLLSSPFIVGDGYGTRCSTVVALGRDGTLRVDECRYAPDGEPVARTTVAFRTNGPAR